MERKKEEGESLYDFLLRFYEWCIKVSKDKDKVRLAFLKFCENNAFDFEALTTDIFNGLGALQFMKELKTWRYDFERAFKTTEDPAILSEELDFFTTYLRHPAGQKDIKEITVTDEIKDEDDQLEVSIRLEDLPNLEGIRTSNGSFKIRQDLVHTLFRDEQIKQGKVFGRFDDKSRTVFISSKSQIGFEIAKFRESKGYPGFFHIKGSDLTKIENTSWHPLNVDIVVQGLEQKGKTESTQSSSKKQLQAFKAGKTGGGGYFHVFGEAVDSVLKGERPESLTWFARFLASEATLQLSPFYFPKSRLVHISTKSARQGYFAFSPGKLTSIANPTQLELKLVFYPEPKLEFPKSLMPLTQGQKVPVYLGYESKNESGTSGLNEKGNIWQHTYRDPIKELQTVRTGSIFLLVTQSGVWGTLRIKKAGAVVRNPGNGMELHIDWFGSLGILSASEFFDVSNLTKEYRTIFSELAKDDIYPVLDALFSPTDVETESSRSKNEDKVSSNENANAKIDSTNFEEVGKTYTSAYRMPGTFHDTPNGEDYLGIEEEVKPFADLIASVKQYPPLSIGLFGYWGAGKSFFMHQLKKEVKKLATKARENENLSFHQRIVQIEFNAWHYVDANLWASMVAHIFENLEMEGDEKETDQQRREKLLEKLNGDLSKRALWQKELEVLRAQQTAQKRELEQYQRKRRLIKWGVWGIDKMRETLASKEVKDESRKMKEQLARLGYDEVSNEQLAGFSQELGQSLYHVKAFFRYIFRGPGWPLRLLVMLLLVALPFGVKALLSYKGLTEWEGLGTLISMLAGTVAWLTPKLKNVNDILSKMKTARETIEEQLKKVANDDKIQLPEHSELPEIESNIRESEQQLEALNLDIETARALIHELSASAQLKNFISDRATSDDYRKFQGIVSTVRRDFEKLSQLMLNTRADNGKNTQVIDEINPKYRIDRIVLYIDDLDRCPPQQVVEVLQAVHLLLAFPLFVVVVGVDSRWISKSLHIHYQSLWETKVSTSQNGDHKMGPYDYLEKIFQIPYWVKKMKPEDTEVYIGKLLDELNDSNDSKVEKEIKEENIGSKVNNGAGSGTRSTTYKSDIQTPQEITDNPEKNNPVISIIPEDEDSTPRKEDLNDEETKKTKKPEKESDENKIDAKEIEERSQRSNDLSSEEKAYMKSLSFMVNRSPRSTKRFVNVYRIIRASHTVSVSKGGEANSELVAHNYKAILFLVAVLIGQPELVQAFFNCLQAHANDDILLSEFLSKNKELTGLNRVFTSLNSKQENHGNIRIGELKKYQGLVARYSFRVGHF
jgi:hypothetical protein